MANERIFPKGVMCFKPHSSAPAFVKGTVVITPNILNEWLKEEGGKWLTDYMGNGQIKLQITESKDGKYSIAVDTYKKEDAPVKKKEDFKVNDDPSLENLPF